MKRSFALTATFILFVLTLILSTPYSTQAVPPDKCVKCMGKVQKDYERCVAEFGETSLICADVFNNGIIECFATVCEQ